MKESILSLFILFSANTLQAQPWSQMAVDGCPGSCDVQPIFLHALGNKICYRGIGEGNDDLWVTDAHNNATQMIDICLTPGESSVISPMVESGGKLYFTASKYSSDRGQRVFVTDGTTAGTFAPGAYLTLSYLVPYNNGIIFAGYDSQAGNNGIFKTDGTVSGTEALLTGPTAPNIIYSYAAMNGKLYFSASGLWVTDGTSAGTKRIADVTAISKTIVLNNKLYFFAYDNTGVKQELWESDGTEAGTVKISTFGVATSDLYICNNKLYFISLDSKEALWVTDGTQQGTIAIKDVSINEPANVVFHNINNKLIFSTDNNIIVSDGTLQGTNEILVPGKNVNPTTIVQNNKLYFSCDDRLWVTNSTSAGTHIIDSNIAIQSHYLKEIIFISFNGKTYFEGMQMIPAQPRPIHGKSMLYFIDENDNIKQVQPIITTNETQFDYAILNNSLYISANDSISGKELWRITDFPTGVQEVKHVNENIGIYPNPATNNFSIQNVGSNTIVKLYSLTGQLVLSTPKTEDINIQNLPTGIYIVQVNSDGQIQTGKLIKE